VIAPLVGTSWKMNLTPSLAAAYCAELRALVADVDDRTLFVLPPFPAIAAARAALTGSNVAWGAQDVHPDDSGAHTGDVSAPMLADLGCTLVEVGHHERRRDHHEDDELIARKVAAVQRWGMTAILCVGETSGRRRRQPRITSWNSFGSWTAVISRGWWLPTSPPGRSGSEPRARHRTGSPAFTPPSIGGWSTSPAGGPSR